MKKCLSLILSVSLLFPNIFVFAQEIAVPSAMFETKVVELQRRTEALSKNLRKAEASFNNMMKDFRNAPHYMEYIACNDGDHIAEMEAARAKWQKALNNPQSSYYKNFKVYQAKMDKIFDEFASLSQDINYAHRYAEEEISKKVIERLSYKYTGKAPQVYPKVMPVVDDIAIKHYKNILTTSLPADLTKLQKEMEGMYSYLNIRLNVEDLGNLTKTGETALKIDNRAELFISQQIKSPKEIMSYAYNNVYGEAQRYAVRISLEAGQESTNLISTVRSVQKYIRNFGTSSPNKVSFFRLLRELRPMDKAARAEYVKKITGLSKGERQLITDISKLEYKDKLFMNKMLYENGTGKIVGKAAKAIVATGILLAIGSILTVLTIQQIDVRNEFGDALDYPGIQARIEDGEASEEENLLFYASEEATEVICNNSFHTIKMLETLENVKRANVIAQEIINEQKTRAEVENLIIDSIPDAISFDVNLA